MVAFRLLGITDRRLVAPGHGLDDWLAILCWHGLRGVQLREKDLDDEALTRLAMQCRPIFERHHLQWFVNGSAAVAARVEATGVHLPASGDPAAARAQLRAGALVGQSVHSLDAARAAAAAGADFLVLGPIFTPGSKPAVGPPLGLEGVRMVCRAVAVPVFTVGGMTPERAEACRAAGACGAAAVSALMATDEPEETLAKFEHALEHL